MTEKEALRRQIDAAAGRTKADLVVKNCRIVNVFSGEIESGEIAVLDGVIVGTEAGFEGRGTVDAEGRFAAPGFIDAHTHIESSFLSPEQAGRMLVPRGTATIVADPHEIANVCGLDGVRYMMEAAKGTKLSILFAMPSCVPATPFEDAGAKLDAADMEELLADRRIFGLGEFMNTPGVFRADDAVLDKLTLARRAGKIVDGHAPALSGRELNAYACAGIFGDHECRTAEEIRAHRERHVRHAAGRFRLSRPPQSPCGRHRGQQPPRAVLLRRLPAENHPDRRTYRPPSAHLRGGRLRSGDGHPHGDAERGGGVPPL